jgi:hypothetical protein
MNGWLLLRLLGISVGIITLLGFATDYLHVNFDPYVESVLKVLQEIAGLIVAAPLWEMVLDWLRQHFAWVPTPEAHWKPLYTLSALLLLANWRFFPLYVIPLALVCSLIPAVFAGTMPVGSGAVVAWPLAGFFAFVTILALLNGKWRDALILAACAAALVAAGHFFNTTGEGTYALVGLAAAVAAFALVALNVGLTEAEGTLGQRLQAPPSVLGLNILAALGGALAFGYLFAA